MARRMGLLRKTRAAPKGSAQGPAPKGSKPRDAKETSWATATAMPRGRPAVEEPRSACARSRSLTLAVGKLAADIARVRLVHDVASALAGAGKQVDGMRADRAFRQGQDAGLLQHMAPGISVHVRRVLAPLK